MVTLFNNEITLAFLKQEIKRNSDVFSFAMLLSCFEVYNKNLREIQDFQGG